MIKNLTRRAFLGVAGIAPLSLAACGGSDGSDGAGRADNGIRVMLETNVMSLDTNLAVDGESFEVIADCIDGLTQLDADEVPIPALAERCEVSEDGRTYTFTLRDATWSNGDPVTAADFVFAWRRVCKGGGSYSYMMSDIGQIKGAAAIIAGSESDETTLGVEAKDDRTLVVELEVPVPFFESLMSFPTFYPVNEAFLTSLPDGDYGTSPDTFLSNGAFVLSDYSPGTPSIRLTRNPDYWDADRVALESLSYEVVGSSDEALMAFEANALDVVTVSGDQVAEAKADPEISQALEAVGTGCLWYLTFSQTDRNAEGGKLANANLRLAITNAIDRQALVDNYVMDGSIPTYTAVPPQFAASATTGVDFSADQDLFSDYVGYDVERANKYFGDAKAELGCDTFTFTLLYGDNEGDEVEEVAQAIQDQLEDVLPGITLNLQPTTKAERVDRMLHDDFDIALTRWGADYADPMTFLRIWTTGNPKNSGRWSSEEYDRIIADCTTGQYVFDYDARWAAMHEAEELVMADAVIAPLYTKVDAILIRPSVEGIEFHSNGFRRGYKSVTVS